ncbi:MAG: bifunctional oligoribonuclease/PAP phosphatase NrnA [Treponema sp.]|jgi:phosphoesterase RecJ-like protein|nr:bifunctional oligoribonuclease/PAP phosphatase NrnA [Treponema sp.]
MAVVVPRELLDFIKSGDKFLVVGHKEPDGDCVGSQLALCSVLRRLGKQAIPCSAGPFKRSELKSYAECFISVVGEAERKGAAVIVLDCSMPSRTGNIASAIEGLPIAVIDHHVAGQHTPNAATAPVFLDPLAPSVTVLCLLLIEALGIEPTAEEAELLFFGLCTDTGFFRHTDEQSATTFEYAARLIRYGANPKKIYNLIYGGKNLASRYLLAIQLRRARPYFDGKLLLTSESYEETQQFGLEGRDSDSLYQLLQGVAGVEAIVIIRQETPETCTIGLRSRDWVDVAAIAARFGGGGHKNAAGASASGTIEELQPQILAAFADALS